MNIHEYRYQGVAYRQNDAPDTPWIVSFVAPAEELLEWAGIPRRTDDNMAGFQRLVEMQRVGKTQAFFDMPRNQSPTAIIVGLHPQQSSDIASVTLQFHGEPVRPNIRPCELVVKFPQEIDTQTAVPLIRSQIERRLESQRGPQSELDTNGDSGEIEPDPESDDEEPSVELGRSLLMQLHDRLSDPDWVSQNSETITDLAKPATIIDGQHRLKGAEACERNIPFAVCALFDCSWPEQVFQFTVVNYTARGIPDQFITANAALSLTQPELQQLQSRLFQAGVKVVEYELMKVVHFNDESPFHNLVNLTDRKDPSRIGYKTMVRLAAAWYGAKHQAFRLLLPGLYPELPGASAHRGRVKRWQLEEEWAGFFLDFWKVVHSTYNSHPSHHPGSSLWDVGHSNLIVAIVLFYLQETFFNSLNALDEEFFETKETDPAAVRAELRQKVARRAKKFVEYFPADFFAKKWGFSSLSIGPGRKALSDTFQQMLISKGRYQYEKSALFTGSTQ